MKFKIAAGTFAVAVLGGWFAMVVWTTGHLSPGVFSDRKVQKVSDQIADAHHDLRHTDVVSIYETPVHVPLMFDIDLQRRPAFVSALTKVQVADSYMEIGNEDAAFLLYLSAVGWDQGAYLAQCRLLQLDCQDVSDVRRLAHVQVSDPTPRD